MDFSKVTAYLDSLDKMGIPANDLMVTVDGECVYRHQSGCRDLEGKTPMNGNEVYWVYSMTKPLTCCCALRLIQEGRLSLDDAVCEYIPAFSKYPSMTVEHLMSMRGGLDYDLNAPAIRAMGSEATTQEIVAAIAEKPLCFEPGTDFQYSLCHDVLAAVIEVASGMKFSEFMAETIFKPLGMEHSGFHMTEYQRENMCAQYEMEADQISVHPIDNMTQDYALRENYESGGAGLITTVEDYMKFASAMAKGGGGILTMDTINLWRERLITGKAYESWKGFNRIGYGYALGVRVMIDNSRARSPLGEFGWDGAAGAYVLMDPKNSVAVVYAQHVRSCGFVYHVVHPTVRDLVYEALEM
jgi:CubicO group peptidase (beta-lactamase class C family)